MRSVGLGRWRLRERRRQEVQRADGQRQAGAARQGWASESSFLSLKGDVQHCGDLWHAVGHGSRCAGRRLSQGAVLHVPHGALAT